MILMIEGRLKRFDLTCPWWAVATRSSIFDQLLVVTKLVRGHFTDVLFQNQLKRTIKINGIEIEANTPEEASGLDSGSGSGSVSSPVSVELVSCLSSSEKNLTILEYKWNQHKN